MRSNRRQRLVRSLLALTVLLAFGGCTSLNTLFQKKPQEPPPKEKAAPAPAVKKPAPTPAPVPKTQPAPPATAPSPAKPSPYEHTVRWTGETLSLIAQWYTGSWRNWKALADANPNLNPDRIAIGDVILIPTDLLKTQQPLPHDFVMPAEQKEEPKPTETKQPEKKADELELFGPKQ
jgi:hypothetical protein